MCLLCVDGRFSKIRSHMEDILHIAIHKRILCRYVLWHYIIELMTCWPAPLAEIIGHKLPCIPDEKCMDQAGI